ncbi:MAG: HYR domain-containing protein [Pseudomonadales bacterium]|nr:HYR domain-containing protein [Pseudomonadales bacterium]
MRKLVLRIFGLGFLGLMMPLSAAYGDQQIVTVSPSSPAFGEADDSVVLAIKYATDPVNKGATGLGLKIFYNGDLLQADDLALNEGVGGTPTVGVADDTDDGDNDPSTDKKIIVAWLQKNTTGLTPEPIPWPEIDHTDGVTLYDLTFGRKDAAFVGKTTLNFQVDTAAGFDPLAESVDVIFKDDEVSPVITLDGSSVSVEAGFPLTTEDNTPALAEFIATVTVTDNKDTLTTDDLNAFVSQDGELVPAPEGFAPGVYEVTLTATDSAGNVSEPAVITVTITDTTTPLLNNVVDLEVPAVDKNGVPASVVSFAVTALDSVDGEVPVAYSVGGTDVGENFPLGDTTVTVNAVDAAGNLSESTFTVTVADVTNPVASAEDVTLEADGSTGYSGSKEAILAAVSATDNVDDAPIVTFIDDSLGDLPLGLNSVGVRVKDAAGNSTDAVVSVTVVDTTKPAITVSNLVLTVDTDDEVVASSDARIAAWVTGVTATDIVDGTTTVTNTDLPENFAVGETIVTFTSSDAAGNEATTEGTVVLTVGPAVLVANAITIVSVDGAALPATQAQIAAFISAATATDFAGSVLTVTNDAPDSFPVGPTVVTFSAVDSDGLQGQRSSTVTVVAPAEENDTDNDGMDDLFEVNSGLDPNADDADGDADGDGRSNLDEYKEGKDPNLDDVVPVLTIADAVVTLEATGELGYAGSLDAVIAAVTATDLVDPAPVVSVSESVPDPLPLGDSQVTVLATDAEGNVAEGTVAVMVVDTTAPTISGAVLLVLTVDTPITVASSDARVAAWVAGVSASDIVDGATTVTNSPLPAEFPVGETVITFTSTDAANNTATASATVLVAVGPAVSVADAITVVSLDGAAVAASQSQVAAFISFATATDFSGNTLDVTNDAPDTFPVGETLVTFTAVDADDRQGLNSSSVTVVAASAENDTDNDGIDDLFEVENGLDPNADDAEEDADGDGRSNLDEYLEGKDPNVDDVKPVVTAPADVATGATGALTKVDLGEAVASDTLDGDLTPVADNPGPYAPGSYVITWSATDAAGNMGTATQSVVVSPQVSVTPKGRVAEGADFMVKVTLNGPAPAYPVEIPVTLGGTAQLDSDYTVSAAAIIIESGRMGMMTITVLSDEVEEGTESIEVTLGAPAANAVLGSASTSVISIIETQEPPALKLSVSQGDQNGRKVAAEGGPVVVMLSINDPNGSHTVDWSASDNNLVATSDDGMFEFDPAALAEGGYEVTAIVTDSGITDATFEIGVLIRVSAEAVEADSDGDGVPDSKDTSEETNVIAVDADAGTAAVTADAGVKLVIGDAAQASGTSGIAVSEETIAASGADGGEAPTNGDDEDFNYPAGVYDFQVQDLPVPGQSVRLTIPVAAGIPADAVMRKYTEAEGWFDFVIDENNGVASAAGDDGACPSVGSELYVDGLTEGDTCLQLTVQDGGPNDADGSVNGEYDDPSGIAEAAPVKVVIVPDTSNRKKVGGGCAVSEGGPGDFGLVFLAMLGALGLFRKRLAASFLNR